jgi:DNA-binding NarL/FixJ family response regulator
MRLLLADDHDLVRDTIAAFLRGEGGFEVAEAGDLPAALALARAEGPFELVLLDYSMPGMDGLAGLGAMRAAAGTARVAVMSGTATPQVARAALDAGAAGFLPKTLPAKTLLNAVRFMAMGEQYAPLDFMARAEAPAPVHPVLARLSERERQVLAGLERSLSNKEIARELDLKEVTVKLHVKTLCRKLEARNRTHAALIAREIGAA